MALQPFKIPTIDGDASIPELLSDVLQAEVGQFLCLAALLSNDEKLFAEYWTLSGDGRLVVQRCYSRLAEVLRRDAIEQ